LNYYNNTVPINFVNIKDLLLVIQISHSTVFFCGYFLHSIFKWYC